MLAELKVQPRNRIKGGVGRRKCLADPLRGIGWIDRTDDVLILPLPVSCGNEEGRLLSKRPGDVSFQGVVLILWLHGDKRVRCIERGVEVSEADAAGKLRRARLGEDIDPAVTDAFILRGKRVLVDVDLTDG